MTKDGKYIYCVIDTEQERNFGPIGIGDQKDEVTTIGYDKLSMVVSNFPKSKVNIDRKSLMVHQKVIERVMDEYDSVIPMRYGTVASSAGEVRDLLYGKYREFKDLLQRMLYKVELGVKGVWKDMGIIFDEISMENKEIRSAKERYKRSRKKSVDARIAIGKMVEGALQEKKNTECAKIAEAFSSITFDHKFGKTFGDEMFMNASFLVSRDREKNFDNKMNELSDNFKDRITFKYIGPLPIFNFVEMSIERK